MAKNAKPKDELNQDPRPMDRAAENRLKVMIFNEAIKPTWGCVLYALERTGRITADQKDAGNRYQKLAHDYDRLMDTDPETAADERAIKRVKKRYEGAVYSMGMARRFVDAVIFEELWPSGERGHLAVAQGLEMLRAFFLTGRKSRG